MEGEILSNKISEYLARYRYFVEQENRANRYNINIRAESFFIPILHIIFECSDLINLNLEEKKNYPVLDLGDYMKRIAFQVSSDLSSTKIIDGLQKFSLKKFYLFEKFDGLIFFGLQSRQKTYKHNQIQELIQAIQEVNPNFHFDVEKDIIDIRKVTDIVNTYNQKTKQDIFDILRLEVDGESISPLRKKPDSPRPLFDIPMVGREIEYDLLSNSDKDLLIIGYPGIGKTFLLL